jgi:outer membrane cobalamin receptor
MMNFFTKLFLCLFIAGSGLAAYGQTTVAGTVTDETSGETLIGVNITIKGETIGTITDFDGNFTLTTDMATPFTLLISYIGYASREVEITGSQMGLVIEMEEEGIIMNEVVVSASRVEERILESPVTIEKMDPIAIKQASTADYYDAIANLKGVQSISGSLGVTTINARGFGSISNTRFVQLMDGMDNAAPLLNFPTGNIVGISELDIHSVELIPGAASALYGANAFNGILLMTSRNPFTYQGLSAQVKAGWTNNYNDKTNPYWSAAARYARSFANDKLAFKFNVSYMSTTDWLADDYDTGRKIESVDEIPPNPGDPNFDGLNLLGDETQIFVPMSFAAGLLAPSLAEQADLLAALAPPDADLSEEGLAMSIRNLPDADLRRTGLREEDILEGREVTSFKIDGALAYKINDNIQLQYDYRRGFGDAIYQGSERYALRNFIQQFHKLEVTGDEFFVRAYTSITDDGDSYNLAALGAFMNEAFVPSSASWVPSYLGAYGLLGLLFTDFNGEDISEADLARAHRIARQVADGRITNEEDALFVDLLRGLVGAEGSVPDPGTPEFDAVAEEVRLNQFKGDPPGAGFYDNSRMYHVEFNYNFKKLFDIFDMQVGGNWRQYDLFTDGTVFLEDPDGDGINERIHINEYAGYIQIGKKILDERLSLLASARYDKNENFKGQISPRVSVVYSAGDRRQHNVRASWQTGFRNPSTQDQFIFFPSSAGNLLGSTEANAGVFGLHEGGAYLLSSVSAALAAGDPELLEVVDVPYVQPEKLTAIELGYKGIVAKKLLIDLNGYSNIYKDFLIEQTYALKTGVTVEGTYYQGVDNIFAGDTEGGTTPARFRPTFNAPVKIYSWGAGLGLTYKMPKGFTLMVSYNYDDMTFDDEEAPDGFNPAFNLSPHKWQASLQNRGVVDNFGFDISYRWNSEVDYISSYAVDVIDPYGVLNASASYTVPKMKSIFKVGGQNILREKYRTNPGGPYIGWQFFAAWTFDMNIE